MNLYIALESNNRANLSRSVVDIQRRHQPFKKFCNGRDGAEVLFELLFPDNLPFAGYISNRQREKQNPRYSQMAIRLRTQGREDWPFPRQCSFMAMGSWNAEHPAPLFIINNFIEVADLPARPFEREVAGFAVHDSLVPVPGVQRIQRNNNLLTPELLEDLPPISLETGRMLGDWTEFLAWKQKLIQHKMRGLRYVGREWRGDQIAFLLIGESASALQKDRQALGREDLIAVELGYSKNPWVFALPEREERRRLTRLGQGAKVADPKPLPDAASLQEQMEQCPWATPVHSELLVALGEDDSNDLANAEIPDELRKRILSRIPESGFLSISMAGDMSLVRRHQQSLRQLQEQGGYAPYLASYLFEAAQVSVPERLEAVTQWHRPDLNSAQKEAVVKILSAPDLCLIQGPPGTGKTTVIAEAIIQLVRRGQRVLLASQAHTAVDNALDRLGHDGSLRVVRLARFQDKVSEDGQPFTGCAAMRRYYAALAKPVESRLSGWRRTDDDLRLLQEWRERAEFVLRDGRELNARRELLESELIAAQNEARRARQSYDTACFERDEDHARRTRLQDISALLTGDVHGLRSDLREIAVDAERLAHLLIDCEKSGLHMQFTLDDWHSQPASRGEILAHLLSIWRRFSNEREAIGADIRRLRDATNGSLQDAETRLRIESLRREVDVLADQMEADNAYVEPWRAKRKEIKELEQSGSALDGQRYQIFAHAVKWRAPIENASRLADEISACISVLQQASPAIEQAVETLQHQTDRQLSTPALETPSDQEVQAAQSQERRIEKSLADLHKQYLEHAINETDLLSDDAIKQGNRLPSAPDSSLAQRMETASQAIEALKQREFANREERQIWRPLLEDWAQDLQRSRAAEEDWQHMGADFLASCNVVAITCNENERTLDEAGQTSFDVAIIDEVSKATPLELLMPLMRARRAVLVGDHRQLPPLFQEGDEARSIQDEMEENEAHGDESNGASAQPLLTRENLRRFEKMVTASLFKSHFEIADDAIRSRLNEQFRMHPQIMGMVNHFYNKRLSCGIVDADKERFHGLSLANVEGGSPLLTPDDHVLWVDTTYNLRNEIHREDMSGNQPLRTNRLEAELIAETLEQINRQSETQGYSSSRKRKVGVVSFYANQCREIRAAMRRRRPQGSNGRYECLDVEVNTVIRYQGKEKPIILVSLVRHDGHDPKRSGSQPRRRSSKANVARFEFINVAFSRAQELLVVFGASSMYESYEVDLPYMDQAGTEKRTVYKDILNQLERDARLVPARQLMTADRITTAQPQSRRTYSASQGNPRSDRGGRRP
ncbi:AAA domain-containing protein [Pseudomonas capsici]|uniref:AAA domain-containing protein n=1 Tax=Pseudomonas capsici TaxID=2810614 RepID=UPI0021F198C7|nr:AAA domain-containing protein [Pseudomonas capsici]MCV4285122.1 AAA domain-containing protein [Pseudomonas capsici]